MRTLVTRHQPSRPAIRAVVLLTAFVALLVATAPASAAQSCGRAVVDDWWDGRIDGTYDLHCYDDAIEILPRDVRDYSSAEDDIKRALAAARRGEPAPPNKSGPRTTPKPTNPPPTNPDTTPPNGPGDDPPPTDTIAAPEDTGSSASSVPIPLLILGGLALLLVAAGSAGYIVRRLQARRPPPAV